MPSQNWGTPLRLAIPADLSRLAEVREWVGTLGRSARLSDSRLFDVQVAVSEATANAVEHAASEVELTAWLLPDRLLVEVTNDGVFQPGLCKDDDYRRRGLGLPLMVSLADQVHVSRLSAAKTKVSLTFFLEPSAEVSPAPAQELGVLRRFSKPSAIAWLLLPVPIFILLVAIFWAVDSESAREVPALLTIFNTLFVASASLAVAYFAGFSYLRTGSLAILLLGAGGIILGLDYLVIGPLVATDLNAAVTIHNAGVLCAGLLFAASGILASRGPGSELGGRAVLRLSAGYLGALGFTVALIVTSVAGLLPDFFVEGQGYTWIRITVLALAVVAFLVAALSYFLLSRRRPSPFVILAAGSFCLFFVAFGILALTDAPSGSPISWAGRAGQWMAGTYLLAAVYSLERGGRSIFALEQSLHEVEDRYKHLIDLTPDAVLIHARLTFVAANPAAAVLLGVSSPTELIGRSVEEFLAPETRDLSIEKIELVLGGAITAPTEERYLRVDGTAVDVEVTRSRVAFGGQLAVQTVARDITEPKRAEEALKRTRSTLAEAQKIAHLGSFEYHAATRTTVWSEEEYRIYGLDPVGPSPAYDVMLARCIHPDDAALLHETFTKAMQSCSVYELEHRIVRPDGSVRWVYDRAHPYFDEKGNLMRYVGATLDITDHHRAEEALRESQRNLDRAQEVGQIGWWRLDTQENALTWSDENHRIFGVPKGAPLTYEAFLDAIHPEDREYVDREWNAGLRGEPYDIEHRIIANDRVKWVREKAYLEFDDAGRLLGGFGITQDITGRKQAEEALRESEERYRLIFETANEGIWVTDGERRTILVNQRMADMLGYTTDELQGRIPSEFLHTGQEPVVLKARQDLTGGAATHHEFRFRRKDGSDLWVISNAAPVRDCEGRLIVTISMLTDITERRRAEEALKQSRWYLSFLLELSDALTPIEDPIEIEAASARVLAEWLDADRVFYGEIIVEDGVQTLVIRRDYHAPGVSSLTGRFPFKVFSNTDYDDYRAGRTVWSANTQTDVREPGQREAYRAADTAAFIGVPLIKRGELVSVLGVLQREPREWTPEEIRLAEETIDRTWQAAQRARAEEALRESEARYRLLAQENEHLYRQQLNIAENLQAAFVHIPSELGPLRLGHLYRSATEAARVGGDFYDVFEVKDNKMAVLIGDVAGHGIEAARAATLVKDVVHAFIHQSLRTHEVLRRTNKLLIEKGLPGYVTLFLGILDTRTGVFRYSSAGHPDMLVRRASAEIERLPARSSPLGIYADAVWKSSAVELQADDLLVLFTDGVIEARHDGELFGEERLDTLVRRRRIPAERLPQVILDQVLSFSEGMLRDDLAILTLRLETKAEAATSKKKSSTGEKLSG